MAARRTDRRTHIDYIIAEKLKDISEKHGFFEIKDVVFAVMNDPAVAKVTKDLRERFDRRWQMEDLFQRFLHAQVRRHLRHSKDSGGLRKYESYSDGAGNWRWQPLRYVTRQTLRAIIAERRTLAGRITAQIKRYEIILNELDKYNDRTQVDTVLDDAVTKIRKAESEERKAKKSA